MLYYVTACPAGVNPNVFTKPRPERRRMARKRVLDDVRAARCDAHPLHGRRATVNSRFGLIVGSRIPEKPTVCTGRYRPTVSRALTVATADVPPEEEDQIRSAKRGRQER